MTADTKEYIGDGVYAATDGYALILTTEDGISVTNTVVLEPREWVKLTEYVEALKSRPTVTELGLAAIEALKEEEARSEPKFLCVNPHCVDGLAPRKTGPDDGDVDMEPCPVCGGPE